MLRLSTGAVNALQANKCMKDIFHDCIIDLYSGAQPADADDAATGVKLCRITLAGGAFTAGIKSTRQVDKITISDFAENNTYVATINGTDYTYTAGAAESVTTVAAGLAALIDVSLVVSASSILGVITVRALYGGVSYTIATSGTGSLADAVVTANARINGLQWAASVIGVLSKESGVWEGVNLATGTAGYARIKANALDDDSESTTLVRLDGAISTSNAFLVIAGSINLAIDATTTIQAGSLTRPKS